MEIFQVAKTFFPSRKIFTNRPKLGALRAQFVPDLAESWRKRRYKAVFKNKLTDAMQEASEGSTNMVRIL